MRIDYNHCSNCFYLYLDVFDLDSFDRRKGAVAEVPKENLFDLLPMRTIHGDSTGQYADSIHSCPSGTLQPKNIHYNGSSTCVEWMDGTKTIVQLKEGDTYDKYVGFCSAMAKKVFGSYARMMETVDAHDSAAVQRRNREAEQDARKKAKAEAHQARMAARKQEHEQLVHARMNQLRIEQEAQRRLKKEDSHE